MNSQVLLWCDSCGDIIDKRKMYHYQALPASINNINQGESASLCRDCEDKMAEKLDADAFNRYFRTNFK